MSVTTAVLGLRWKFAVDQNQMNIIEHRSCHNYVEWTYEALMTWALSHKKQGMKLKR